MQGRRGLLLLLLLSMMFNIVAAASASASTSTRSPSPSPSPIYKQEEAERSGIATFYTKYSPRACRGLQLPRDGLFAAANAALLKRGAAYCGKRVRVRCVGKGCIVPPAAPAGGGSRGKIVPGSNSGGPITVTIVDLCSASCKRSHAALSLSLSAFAHLADPDLGSIRIRYKWL